MTEPVESATPRPTLQVEQKLWRAGLLRVVGVDEAGIGSLAGPVVAGACVLPVGCQMIEGVRDSKLLSPAQRERLFERILGQAVAIGVGAASAREVERLNVLAAAHLAMRRALDRARPWDFALVDGRQIASLDLGPHRCVIDGDALCYSISCASVIAKVTRDRLMCKLAQRHPGYGWERNAGYGTPEHLDALRRLGLTPHHRHSFQPVRTLFGETLAPGLLEASN